ncbi:ATP-binding protein [Streptomyces chartreusis]|uniref:ATP-binding protein n=1 Tax=Streptomyces chartreusis TaxID=1969 RepID=UPI003868F693
MPRRLEESPYAFTVPPVDKAVPVARERVADRARQIGLPLDEDLVQDLELLTTEVVTNSITHTKASCAVCVRWTGERLRVEVTDVDPTLLSPSCAGPLDEGGRGLFLVDALATAWGTETCSAGKTTWFELEPRPTQATSLVQVSSRSVAQPSRTSVTGCTDPASVIPRSEGTRVALPSRGAEAHHQAA